MPKVNDAHFEERRREILAAARRVAATMPIGRMTMKDVVRASGMSQGGVYKYFENIDALFVALLNEGDEGRALRNRIDAAAASDEPPGRKLAALFALLGSYAEQTFRQESGIRFELLGLLSREPARFERIREQLQEATALERLQHQLRTVVNEGIAAGAFRPDFETEALFDFVQASVQGLVDDAPDSTAVRQRVDILAEVVALLLHAR